MKVQKSKAHGDKLKALLSNAKLPNADKKRVEISIGKYDAWVKNLDDVKGTADEILSALVAYLNDYKREIEFELIFNANDDFLYRQNGQLKLANSILEEFLPRLFDVRLVPGLKSIPNAEAGCHTCFSHLSFGSHLLPLGGGGVFVKVKDQDFSVTRSYKVVIEHAISTLDKFEKQVNVAYFATEIKTNLDKTMFQEASATAGELKAAVPGARYILLCEWLDMSPVDTKLTLIDEVIILRKQKRIASSQRGAFSEAAGRQAKKKSYEKFLADNPIHKSSFERFIFHLNEAFPEKTGESEKAVLERGYF